MGFSLKNFLIFLFFLIVEILIGVYGGSGTFIRNTLGDAIVVILIYFFIKTFYLKDCKYLFFWIFIFALCVEISQYYHILDILGLSKYRLILIIFGGTFDFHDIIAYAVGSIAIFIFPLLGKIILKKSLN